MIFYSAVEMTFRQPKQIEVAMNFVPLPIRVDLDHLTESNIIRIKPIFKVDVLPEKAQFCLFG